MDGFVEGERKAIEVAQTQTGADINSRKYAF